MWSSPSLEYIQQVSDQLKCTVKLLLKHHTWEENNLVFAHRWSLITRSFLKKMSNWDREICLLQIYCMLERGDSPFHWYMCMWFSLRPQTDNLEAAQILFPTLLLSSLHIFSSDYIPPESRHELTFKWSYLYRVWLVEGRFMPLWPILCLYIYGTLKGLHVRILNRSHLTAWVQKDLSIITSKF